MLGIDWHKTLAADNGTVSSANRSLLSDLIQAGYRIAIVSFASSRQRQEQAWPAGGHCSHNIGYPLRLILCPRKLSSDPERGDVVCKSEAILQEHISVFVDDPAYYLTRYPAVTKTSAEKEPDHLLIGRKQSRVHAASSA